ncbi:MAG: hypothetical protein JSS95_13400 [Acidobacteria bacterium]|nr:hypothetical protein [Acidobacteriota bacterium]
MSIRPHQHLRNATRPGAPFMTRLYRGMNGHSREGANRFSHAPARNGTPAGKP